MKPLKYENENYEVLFEKHLFIKDKKKNIFFKNTNFQKTPDNPLIFTPYLEKVSASAFLLYLFLLFIMVLSNYIYVMYLQTAIAPKFNKETLIVITIYFLINIFLHELGHINSLKYFGRKWDKVGFKLNFYVFPAFYVQMNETYMLSKRDKIIVHSFGLFVNYMIINGFQLLNVSMIGSYNLTISYMLFSSTMIWNLIPILNSDGYKIMLAFFSLDEYSNFTKNHLIVLGFQIIGVIIAINTLVHWIIYWIQYL